MSVYVNYNIKKLNIRNKTISVILFKLMEESFPQLDKSTEVTCLNIYRNIYYLCSQDHIWRQRLRDFSHIYKSDAYLFSTSYKQSIVTSCLDGS